MLRKTSNNIESCDNGKIRRDGIVEKNGHMPRATERHHSLAIHLQMATFAR